MRRRLAAIIGGLGLIGVVTVAGGATSGASAAGCPIFPADNVWHADVSHLAVNSHSDAWLASMGGPSRHLHPDFGPSGDPMPYGIPYDVVDSSTPKVGVSFDYSDESDPGPYPFGAGTTIESGSDRHALVIDRDACVLYELYGADWNGGQPTAGSGAVYDLRSNALRPAGWTSADAAGLPIFPGLLRLDEVRSGNIDHAIRVTAQATDRSYVWPARHQAGSANNPNLPPMGAWFRMKADFDISHYSPETQVILTAFKVHGMVVADNGSNWYFGGSADDGWDEGVLDELKSIPAGAFEAIDASPLMVSPNSGQARVVTSTPPGSPAPAPATAPKPPAKPSGGAAPAAASTTTSTSTPPDPTTTVPVLPVTPPEPSGTTRVAAGPGADAGGGGGPGAAAMAVSAIGVLGTGAAGWFGIRRRRGPPVGHSPVEGAAARGGWGLDIRAPVPAAAVPCRP